MSSSFGAWGHETQGFEAINLEACQIVILVITATNCTTSSSLETTSTIWMSLFKWALTRWQDRAVLNEIIRSPMVQYPFLPATPEIRGAGAGRGGSAAGGEFKESPLSMDSWTGSTRFAGRRTGPGSRLASAHRYSALSMYP